MLHFEKQTCGGEDKKCDIVMCNCFILQHVHAVFPYPASVIQVLINEKIKVFISAFLHFSLASRLKIKASCSQFQFIQVRLKSAKCHQDFSWPPKHPTPATSA